MWCDLRAVQSDGVGELPLISVGGKVKEASTTNETHVKSSGGGGVVTAYGGVVQPTKVRSEIKYKTRVRLVDATAGTEADIVFPGEVHFSSGDEVQFYGYRKKGLEIPLRWVNRTTGKTGQIYLRPQLFPAGFRSYISLPGFILSRTFAKRELGGIERLSSFLVGVISLIVAAAVAGLIAPAAASVVGLKSEALVKMLWVGSACWYAFFALKTGISINRGLDKADLAVGEASRNAGSRPLA